LRRGLRPLLAAEAALGSREKPPDVLVVPEDAQDRGAAKRSLRGVDVANELRARGITVKTNNMASLAEEASQAYKDVTQVVEVTHQAGISRKVAMASPIGVIKG
jgi:RNA-splicing ligase RtcB